MALSSIPLSWLLGVLIVILVLALILVLIVIRIRKTKIELIDNESDIITPFMRLLNKYGDSSLSVDSRLNTLSKISRQFFKLKYNYSSEKTFDEISDLGKDDLLIKKFADDMAVLRYSGEKITLMKINELFTNFSKILSNEKARIMANPSLRMAQYRYNSQIRDSDVRKSRDIDEIRKELDKLKTQPPIKINKPSDDLLSSTKGQIASKPVNMLSTPGEQLNSLESELSKDKGIIMPPIKGPVKESSVDNQNVSTVINDLLVNVDDSHELKEVKDQGTDFKVEKAISVNEPEVLVKRPIIPKKIIKPVVVKALPVPKIKGFVPPKNISKKEQEIMKEINSLNNRIESLMNKEAESRLSQIRDGYY